MTISHDLAHEFPEMKDAIHALKGTDRHFRRLFDQYTDITKTLHAAGEGTGGIADEQAEDLKKQRLHLKDELFTILLKTKGGCGGVGGCGCQG